MKIAATVGRRITPKEILSLGRGQGEGKALGGQRLQCPRTEGHSATRLLTVLLLFLIGATKTFGSVRDDIEHQYKRWGRAALVNDVDTILSILAPDYTLHTYTGTVIPRKGYEVSLRKRKAENKPATVYETSMAAITVSGNKAVVTSDETSNNISVDPITNKKVKLVHIHRYLDTWIKSRGTWRLQTTITTVESTKVVPV